MKLRDYQIDAKKRIESAWCNGAKNVCYTMATGGGKTILMTAVAGENDGPTVLIAHRRELVSQISIALCRHEIYHRIIGPNSVINFILDQQIDATGRVYYDPGAPIGVASVDTLIRRGEKLKKWLDKITLWIQDECHHIQLNNKWGRACDLMRNARGLGVTAEPSRSDGGGLGRHADGVFDVIVEGPGARDLINDGWLTDYEIVCPGGKIDLSNVPLSPRTGDFSRPQLLAAVRRSKIVGDVVYNYLVFAGGKLGITFATDVDTATKIAESYNACGVPAAVVSHKTPDAERAATLRRFARRDLLQLVNVDLFGEGFDLPAVECVSMARPTESFGLYLQQCGRALRPMHDGPTATRAERLSSIAASGKPLALIIDHAGNVERHNLPCVARPRSLDRREGKGRVSAINAFPVRVCLACAKPFAAVAYLCPYCGVEFLPANRSAPQFVDGDLALLDREALAALREAVARVDTPVEVYRAELAAKGAPYIGQLAHVKRHAARQDAQKALRLALADYCQQRAADGLDVRQIQRSFYLDYQIDILSARALGTRDAEKLTERIKN